MGSWMSPGSLPIRNLERAYNTLVRDGGLESGAHGTAVNDPVYLKRMEMVNDLQSWLKRNLWRFMGMSCGTSRRISAGTSGGAGSTSLSTDGARPKGRSP